MEENFWKHLAMLKKWYGEHKTVMDGEKWTHVLALFDPRKLDL
jgi:hypothetical protein